MARQWRDDAELKRVKASVIAPRQFGALYVDFHFESPSEDQLRYEITCSARSCFPRELAFPRTDYEPIEFDEEMIDSIEAATIGHQNGGKPFASVRRGTMRVSLQWDASHDVGSTVWMAYYSDLVGALYIFIDPYTGEVIRIED